MAKSAEARAEVGGYFAWSRDPAVGLFAVLPLWLAYEALRFWLTPDERNLSEWLLLDLLGRLGPVAGTLLRLLFAAAIFVAMRSVLRRQIPWGRVALVLVLEGMVYGLLLGPLAGVLAEGARLLGPSGGGREQLAQNLVSSLGAGLFEELVFRLGLMSLLVWLWLRASTTHHVSRVAGGIAAVVISAALFSLHHHLREPFDRGVFLYRTMAGVILGFLFWFRGFGVCVYTHAMYDVYYFVERYVEQP